MQITELGKRLFKISVYLKDKALAALNKSAGMLLGAITGFFLSPFWAVFSSLFHISKQKHWAQRLLLLIFSLLLSPLILIISAFAMVAHGLRLGFKEGIRGIPSLFNGFNILGRINLNTAVQYNNTGHIINFLDNYENPFEIPKNSPLNAISPASKALSKSKYIFSLILRYTKDEFLNDENMASLAKLLIKAEKQKKGSLNYFLKGQLNDNKPRRDEILIAILQNCPLGEYQYYLEEIIKIVQTSFFRWRKDEQLDDFLESYVKFTENTLNFPKKNLETTQLLKSVYALFKALQDMRQNEKAIAFLEKITKEQKFDPEFIAQRIKGLYEKKLKPIENLNENNKKDKEMEKEEETIDEIISIEEVSEPKEQIGNEPQLELESLYNLYYEITLAKYQLFSGLLKEVYEETNKLSNEEAQNFFAQKLKNLEKAKNDLNHYFKPLKKLAKALNLSVKDELWMFQDFNKLELRLDKIKESLETNLVLSEDKKLFEGNEASTSTSTSTTQSLDKQKTPIPEIMSNQKEDEAISWKKNNSSGFASLIEQFGYCAKVADTFVLDAGRCARDLTKAFLSM